MLVQVVRPGAGSGRAKTCLEDEVCLGVDLGLMYLLRGTLV